MEQMYEFYNRLTQVHKPHRVRAEALAKLEGVHITDSWRIVPQEGADIVLNNAAWDLSDYFAVSMDTPVALVSAGQSEKHTIWIGIDETLGERDFRIQVQEDRIVITGNNGRTAAQGCYALEDALNLNEAPVIEICDIHKHIRLSPRLIQTGLRYDVLPDEHLRMMAHAGYDATLVLSTRRVMENEAQRDYINDVIARAANYGLDVYSYTPFHNTMHPDEPGAFEYYESTFGKLVELCPGIRGLIMLGESCEFPSKDERTTGKSWKDSLEDDKPSPGWFPCRDYPQFAKMVLDVIHKHNPNVELIFWTYNWGYEEQSVRQDMLRNMPEGVTMMATFEMFEDVQVAPGITENTVDYTLWQIGPGKYYRTEAAVARERGLKMLSMTNTGGNTWDFGGIPYVPAPQRWIERFQAVVDAQDNLRLDGGEESHTYGFWQSILTTLAKYAFMTPQEDLHALLRRLVIRDYGEEQADIVLKVFELFSQGMAHCVSTNQDQYGPARVGPLYPLIFEKPVQMPIAPDNKGNPNWVSNPVYRYNLDQQDKLQYEINEYESVARLFEAGCAMLSGAITRMPQEKQEEGSRLLGIGRYIAASARTIVHVKRWHILKGKLGIYLDTNAIWVGGRKNMLDARPSEKPLLPTDNPVPVILELIEIAKAEIENTRSIIPYVEADSRLGFNQEFLYANRPEQLQWKIEHTQQVIDEELLPLLAKNHHYE